MFGMVHTAFLFATGKKIRFACLDAFPLPVVEVQEKGYRV
jgi:hypothetical protein